MPLSEPLTAARASSVRFELPPPHEGEVVIPAPSLQQVADCLRLDPKKDATPETDRQRITRLLRQAEILLGKEFAYLTGVLTMGQMAEVVQALYLAAIGIDPTDFVAVQAYLQKMRTEPRAAAEVLADVQKLIIRLAAELRVTPEEAGKMPVADAISLRDELLRKENEQAKFQMAIHGATSR